MYCKECKKKFIAYRKDTQFCKPLCAQTSWHKRNPTRALELSHKWKEVNILKWKYTQTIKRKTKGQDTNLIISREEFFDWMSNSKLQCEYCELQLELIIYPRKIMTNTTNIVTIDRKDSTKSYLKGNLALACLFCNRLKSFIFTYEEMKVIGSFVKKAREEGRLIFNNTKFNPGFEYKNKTRRND